MSMDAHYQDTRDRL
jgi:hypothetical protein